MTFGERDVTLNLPASKVDWKAKGTRRSWQCICGTYPICPYHVLKGQVSNLGTTDVQSPLFPSEGGRFRTKDGVTATIREAARQAGQQVQDLSGAWLISCHTFRITGARTPAALAWLGLDDITIQLLGRWGSDAVLSYLAEAPLTNLCERPKRPPNEARLAGMNTESQPSTRSVPSRVDELVYSSRMRAEYLDMQSNHCLAHDNNMTPSPIA